MLCCQLGSMLDPHIQILEIHKAKGAETFQYIKAISKNQRIFKESKITKQNDHNPLWKFKAAEDIEKKEEIHQSQRCTNALRNGVEILNTSMIEAAKHKSS